MSGTEVWIEATGSNKSDAYWTAWADFLAGHWQRERPTKPGAYPTADRDGNFNGYDRIALVEIEGQLKTIMPGGDIDRDDWLGWWWSEPMPKLPKPTSWECSTCDGSGIVGHDNSPAHKYCPECGDG